MLKSLSIKGVSVLAIMSSLTMPALAQVELDEIIVTATKRATGLQDTPIAITAVSAQKLERQNIDDISEIASFTPNLTFDTTAPVSGLSSGAIVFIRGVGQTDFQLTTDPGVGTYVDGVYASRSAGGVLDVLDLERVEVLRGPQGTLFGRNTIGGAINLISKRPGDVFGGNASITAGSRSRLDISANIDIPVSDNLRTRLSFSSKNQDGYVKGLSDDRDLGDVNRDSIRAVAEWTPSDNFKATVAIDGGRVKEQNAASKLVGITVVAPGSDTATEFAFDQDTNSVVNTTRPQTPGAPTLTFLYNVIDATFPGGQPFGPNFITDDLDTTFATGPNGTDLQNVGGSLTLDWQTSFADIKTITAFRDSTGQFARDADGSPLAVTHTNNFDYDHEQFSQELQLTGDAIDGALKWVAGAYYFNETGNDNLAVTLPQGFGTVLNFASVDNESIAAYVQGTYAITDALSATGGIRYTEDDKSYTVPEGGGAIVNGFAGVFGPLGTSTPFFPAGENNEKFDDVSYKLGLDYNFGGGTLVYGSFSTGFKSGGFNTRYLVPVPSVVSFDPETLETFELGVKWQGLDNRVRANLAAFVSDYEDIQLVVYDSGAPLTRNAGTADIKGVEAEITAIVTEGLELSIGTGFTDAEYSEVLPLSPTLPAFQQVQLDTALPNTPKFTLSAAIDYEARITETGDVRFHADWAHKSSIENDAVNSPFLTSGKTDVFNASVGYVHNDGQWSLTGFVDNLSDERFITSGDSNFGIGFHEANFNRPREYGLKLRTEF